MRGFVGLLLFLGAVALTQADARCDRCKHMVRVIKTMTSYETRDRMYQTICETFLESDRETCRSTFHQMTPEDTCLAIGECSPDAVSREYGDADVTEIEMPSEELGLNLCSLCQTFTKVAQQFLSSPANQKFLLGLLKTACHFLPFFGHQCCYLVNQYGSLVLRLASQFINPGLCKILGLCSKDDKPGPNSNCQICEMSMGIVYDTLHDPALGQRIEEFTKDLCLESIGLDKTCHSLGQEVSQSVMPALHMLRKSDFLKGVCQMPDVCKKE